MSTGFELYVKYLALKRHFSDEKYDFFRYNGKVRCSEESFTSKKNQKNFHFFQRLAAKYTAVEAERFLVSNFLLTSQPKEVWFNWLVRHGETSYRELLTPMEHIEKQMERFVTICKERYPDVESVFRSTPGNFHPGALRSYLAQDISIVTLLYLDGKFRFKDELDETLTDSIWTETKFKLEKSAPWFDNIMNWRVSCQ